MDRGRQMGLTTVEFSIVGLVLFVLLFGVIEVGRALFVWNTIVESTRRAARVAAVCPIDHNKVKQVAIFSESDVSPLLPNLDVSNIQLSYLDINGSPSASYASIRYVNAAIQGYAHTLLIPVVGTTITMPPFSTTLPAESLGWVPEDKARVCF